MTAVQTTTTELNRTIRHAVVPLAFVAVERGWLPEGARNDAVEFGVIAVSFVAVYVLSVWRDYKARKTAA